MAESTPPSISPIARDIVSQFMELPVPRTTNTAKDALNRATAELEERVTSIRSRLPKRAATSLDIAWKAVLDGLAKGSVDPDTDLPAFANRLSSIEQRSSPDPFDPDTNVATAAKIWRKSGWGQTTGSPWSVAPAVFTLLAQGSRAVENPDGSVTVPTIQGGTATLPAALVNAIRRHFPASEWNTAFHVAASESGGRLDAVGALGEIGAFQIMPMHFRG